MTSNVNVKLHYYRFNLSGPRYPSDLQTVEIAEQQREAYEAVCDAARASGANARRMNYYTGGYNKPTREFQTALRVAAGCATDSPENREYVTPLVIETAHLFADQWNTAPIEGASKNGLRVHQWVEWDYPNKHIREGYWIELSDEIKELLRNTHVCGYCGKQEPAQKGYTFCPHCIDSEYLTASDLHLTRMVSIADSNKARAPLSDAEKAHLLPLYRDAQINRATVRGKARIEKARVDTQKQYDKAVASAQAERAGALWTIDNVPGLLGNWIYYSHTDKHCFGWRVPLDAGVVETLLEKISEFPGAYEIKCADGRTLEGY